MDDHDKIAVVVENSRRELAGKYLGHTHTRIMKRREKGNCISNAYVNFFYDQRPNVATEKTRKAHWEKLHSSQRFIQALFCYFGPPSHLLRNLRLPLSMIAVVSVASAVYYGIQLTMYPQMPNFDEDGNLKALFSLGSFAVSLLLAMRLNRTYERFWLARQSFGGIGFNNVQAVHWMAVWCEDKALVPKFMSWLSTYHYAVMKLMLAQSKIHPDVAAILSPEELAVVDATEKPRELAALQIINILGKANLGKDQVLVISELLNNAAKEGGTCVRIKFQAIPYSISLVCTGFVFIWLLFLPLGLFRGVQISAEFAVVDIVCQYVVMEVAFLFLALLLLACDEISNQLEDPFYQLPLYEIAKSSGLQLRRTIENLEALNEANAKETARLEAEKENCL